VYEIRHLDSGMRYIGISQNISHRWDCHRSMLRRGTHRCRALQLAWDRSGAASFEFAVRELVAVDRLLAAEAAHFLIAGASLFNIKGPIRRAGWHHTPESRAKMSAALKGMKLPPHHRNFHKQPGDSWEASLRERVRTLRTQGLSFAAIQSLTGASPHIARRVCADVPLTPVQSRERYGGPAIPTAEVPALVARCNAGETLDELAQSLGVHPYTVRRAFSRAGVVTTKRRKHASALRTL
jgi:hypothetical protein